MLSDFNAGLSRIKPERDALEKSFSEQIDTALDADPSRLSKVVDECWRQAASAESRWIDMIEDKGFTGHGGYGRSWAQLNFLSGLSRT